MQQETIENYLKTIYHLSNGNQTVVSNKELALKLGVIPATVTEALKKLNALKLVIYEKSYGARLTTSGARQALSIVRRHRIWETYLVKELGFEWDEVHEIAEELEHVGNEKLIARLSSKLGDPLYDPHGEPIPNEKGKFEQTNLLKLSETIETKKYIVCGLSDHSPAFFKFLRKHQLNLNTVICIKRKEPFDGSVELLFNKKTIYLSKQVAEKIIVREH